MADKSMNRREFLGYTGVGLGLGALSIAGLKIIDSIFTADAKFNDYKGEWEPYGFRGEDKTMYNVGLRCVKKLGANGEHWRNMIADYPKNKGINWGRLQHGDTFWVPKDCDCSARYKK